MTINDPFNSPITPEPSALPAPALGEELPLATAATELPQYGAYATNYPDVELPQAPQVPLGYDQQVAPRTNTIATVALVLSLLSVTLPALICGIIGLNRAKERGGLGRGQSIAAIIISLVWLVIGIAIAVAISTGSLNI